MTVRPGDRREGGASGWWRAALLVAAVWGCAGCADALPPEASCDAVVCAEGEICVGGRCRAGSENNASENNSTENNASENNASENNASENNASENNASENNASENNASENNASENNNTPDVSDEPDAPAPEDVPEEPDALEDVPEEVAEDVAPEVTDEPDVVDEEVREEACAEARAFAMPATLPVDILWFIDNSGSMNQEEDLVEDKINDFVRFITAQSIDYRVVMVTGNDVCVPAPLGGGGCPDTNTDFYLHVRRSVDSHDGLEKLWQAYPQYQSFLRPGAKTHMVAVTDDESDWSAGLFRARMQDLVDPGVDPAFRFHSIVAYGDIPFFGCIGIYGTGAGIGDEYLELSRRTGGVTAPICQENWDAIFLALAEDVVETTVLPCQYAIPTPGGEFEQIDPEEVNVYAIPPGGQPTVLPNVIDAAACQGQAWYYDDPFEPTTVILCPDACGFQDGSIEIEFGCDTIKR